MGKLKIDRKVYGVPRTLVYKHTLRTMENKKDNLFRTRAIAELLALLIIIAVLAFIIFISYKSVNIYKENKRIAIDECIKRTDLSYSICNYLAK